MRAIAQLLTTVGGMLRIPFLTKIGQGMNQAAVVKDRAKNVAKSANKSDSKDEA